MILLLVAGVRAVVASPPAVVSRLAAASADRVTHLRSGMKAKDTICAEMAFMLSERNDGASSIDYPVGGSGAICEALVRGIEKHGGQLVLNARVEHILTEGAPPAQCRKGWRCRLAGSGNGPAPCTTL